MLSLSTSTWWATRPLHISDVEITPPTVEPVDLDEFKKHIRFTPTSEDTLIDTYIATARQYFAQQTGVEPIDTVREVRMDAFPTRYIELPRRPLIEVVSVSYTDADDVLQTLAVDTEYLVGGVGQPRPGVISVLSGASWPTPKDAFGSVAIRYRAGYGSHPGDVPEMIRAAIAQLAARMHRDRDGSQNPSSTFLDSLMLSLKYEGLPVHPQMREAIWLA